MPIDTKADIANDIREMIGNPSDRRLTLAPAVLDKTELVALADHVGADYDEDGTNAAIRAAIMRATRIGRGATAADSPDGFTRFEMELIRERAPEAADA